LSAEYHHAGCEGIKLMTAGSFSGLQPRCDFLPALVAVSWLFLHVGLTGAQTANPPELVAKDLREEAVHIAVTAKDLYGRQETRNIPVTIYRPAGEGPFPLAVFNHGRAVTAKRAAQGLNRPETVARYLVGKGFVVMAPTRIGYAETYGEFDPEASGSCSNPSIEPMSTAASDQVLATVEFARTQPYVDATRWLVAGVSVGGLTSVATVGRNPPGLLAGINFAGGAGGNPEQNPGRPCGPHAIANYWGFLAKSAKVPMLWLYWKNDKYWGEEIPKKWHKAWVDGGGLAEMTTFAPSGDDGHLGLAADMDHWLPVVDAFLAQLGFSKPAMVVKPPVSAFADLSDTSKVPVSAKHQPMAYAKFLDSKLPRAFAVSERGGYGSATGDYAVGRALGNCQRYGFKCQLYAVDNEVVWTGN
jgi:dienelactone hydrolase